MYCEVSELLGKTLVSITGAKEGNNEIIFECLNKIQNNN